MAVIVSLVIWNAGAGVVPDIGYWPDTLFIAYLLLPLTLLVPLLALPLVGSRMLLPGAVGFAVLAVGLHLLGMESLFNVAKLLALTALGFWFMQLFEELSWVVLIALIIPWVDALSVWRGPTDYVVSEQPGLFERVSIAFRLPGEDGSANIGPPDILFFALFLSAAQRFGLRVVWTWFTMVGFLSATLLLTTATDISGLPALPAIALGFVLPNADLIWSAWRKQRRVAPDET